LGRAEAKQQQQTAYVVQEAAKSAAAAASVGLHPSSERRVGGEREWSGGWSAECESGDVVDEVCCVGPRLCCGCPPAGTGGA
jgi:hypothetical protein